MIRHFTTYPVINILTRSGRRESCFKSLKKTLNSQTFNNYNHIISNDNIDNLFLKNEKNVIDVIFKPKSHSRDCPYNDYLNVLKSHAKEGWCIILDDDAKFIDKNFLKNLASYCKNYTENDIIIYDIYIGDINKKKKNSLLMLKIK